MIVYKHLIICCNYIHIFIYSSADIREVKMINLRKEVFRLQQLVLDMHSLKVKEEDHLRQELISQNRENALLLSQILSGSPTTRESSVSSPRSPLLLENSFMVNRSTSPVLFAATKSPASPKSVLKDDLTNVSTVVVSLKQQDVQKLEKACEVSTQLTNRLSSFISTMPAAPRLLAQEYEQFMSRLKQLLSSLIKVSDELMKPAHFFSLAGLSKLEKIASQQSSRVTLVEASITFLASKIHEMFSEIGLHRKYMTALADILGVANSRSYLECSTVGQLEQIKLGFETWQVEKSTLRQLVVDESTSSNNEMMDKNTTTKFATVATSPLRSTTPITSTKQVSTSPLRSLPTRQVSDNAMQTMPVIEDVHAKRLMTTAVQSDLMYTDVMSRAEWGSLKSDYDLKLQEKQALIALMDEQTRTFMFRSNSSTSTQTSTKSKTPIGVQTEKERGQAASFLPSPMLQDSSSQYDGVMGLGTSQNAHAQTSTSPVRMVTTVSTQSRILNTSDSASMTEEKERISTSTQMSSSTTSSPPRSANPVVDRVISPHIFAFTGPDSPKTTTTANSNKSKNVQLRVRERSISVQKTTTVSKTTGNIHHRQHVDGDSLVLDEEEIERTFMLEIDEEGSTSISLDLAGLLESLSPKSGRALQEKLEEEEDAGAQVARTFDQLRNSFGIDNIKANLEPLVATAHEALEADYGHQQQQLTPRQERAMMELQQRQVDESQYHQQNVDFDPVRQELVIIEDIAFVRSLSNASLSQTADAIKSYYQQQQESSETSHFLSREYLQDIKDETRASLAETANAIRQYSQHESKLVSIDGQSLTSSMDEEAMMVEMDAIHKESSISLEKTAESIRMYEERLMAIMASGGGRQYEDEDQENNVRYEQDIAHIKAATQSSIEETARIIKKYGGAGVGVEVKSASGIVSTSPLLTRNRSKSDLVPTPVGSTLGRLYQ